MSRTFGPILPGRQARAWANGWANVLFCSTLFFSIGIYFTRISRLKVAKFLGYFENKAEAEILILIVRNAFFKAKTAKCRLT